MFAKRVFKPSYIIFLTVKACEGEKNNFFTFYQQAQKAKNRLRTISLLKRGIQWTILSKYNFTTRKGDICIVRRKGEYI